MCYSVGHLAKITLGHPRSHIEPTECLSFSYFRPKSLSAKQRFVGDFGSQWPVLEATGLGRKAINSAPHLVFPTAVQRLDTNSFHILLEKQQPLSVRSLNYNSLSFFPASSPSSEVLLYVTGMQKTLWPSFLIITKCWTCKNGEMSLKMRTPSTSLRHMAGM